MPSNTTDALIDHAAVEELREAMGPAAFADIAATFCDQVGIIVARFARSVRAADLCDVAHAVHELVGLAGTMGAPRLDILARQAAALCRNGQVAELGAMIGAMEQAAKDTVAAFQCYV